MDGSSAIQISSVAIETGLAAMQTKTIIQMIVLLVLLILSGLFSSAETSLTTVNIYKMKALAEE